MKFSNKSGSLPYTLLFCQVIVFSFATAYGVTWLFQRTPAPEKIATAVDRQQLFRNYRILNFFLASGSPATRGEPDAADLENPLLAAIENLKQAQELFTEKKYAAGAAVLALVPDRFPFLAARRDDAAPAEPVRRRKVRRIRRLFRRPSSMAAWRSASCA